MSTRLGIPIDAICIQSFYSNEPFGDWYEEYDVQVGQVATLCPSEVRPLGMVIEYYENDLKEGDIIYVIIATWSTGNSFGNSINGAVDVCSITVDQERAYRNLNLLKQHRGGLTSIELDNGKTMEFYRPWDGYFESLESLEVYEMIVDRLEDE